MGDELAQRILPNAFVLESADSGSHNLGDGQRPPVYLGDALGDDVIRERGELLLQLVEQLHDSDVRAVALPHRGPPSSWQGLPAGAQGYYRCARRSPPTDRYEVISRRRINSR